jgi:hypothetical protein
MNESDWLRAIQTSDKGFVMSFLRYTCEHDRVKSLHTLHQYLRQFKMLYLRVNGTPMNYYDGKEAFKV